MKYYIVKHCLSPVYERTSDPAILPSSHPAVQVVPMSSRWRRLIKWTQPSSSNGREKPTIYSSNYIIFYRSTLILKRQTVSCFRQLVKGNYIDILTKIIKCAWGDGIKINNENGVKFVCNSHHI